MPETTADLAARRDRLYARLWNGLDMRRQDPAHDDLFIGLLGEYEGVVDELRRRPATATRLPTIR